MNRVELANAAERLSRGQAVSRIEGLDIAGCLMCWLMQQPSQRVTRVVERDGAAVVVPQFAVRCGHLLVVPARHVTSMSDLGRAGWAQLCDLAYVASLAVERALTPVRCYIASLGSARSDVPMTSPHLHLHLIPIYQADERPAEVLTWRHGVWSLPTSAREDYRDALLAAWPEVDETPPPNIATREELE